MKRIVKIHKEGLRFIIVIFALLCRLLNRWLMRRGAEIFSSL